MIDCSAALRFAQRSLAIVVEIALVTERVVRSCALKVRHARDDVGAAEVALRVCEVF